MGAASVFPYYLVCCPTGIACCAVTSVSSSLRRPLGGRCVSISLLLGVLSYRYCLLCCDERQFFIEKAYWVGAASVFPYYLVCCPTGIACCAVTSVSSSLRRPLGGRCVSISLLLGVLSYQYFLLLGVLSYVSASCDERQFFIEKAIGWALRQYFLTTWCVVLQVLPAVL